MMNIYLAECWEVMRSLAPWLFLGVVIAGVLHVFLPADFVGRHLGRRNMMNVLKAALIGVPMPLCSCGVIPTAVGLKKDGASDGASVAFLISTPQTGVDSVAVSAAFLGMPFALFKLASAFMTGLIGGWLVNATDHMTSAGEAERERQPAKASAMSFRAAVVEALHFGFLDLLRGIWIYIALGIAVSAAISTYVPESALTGKVWATGASGMLVMLALSIPLYVCTTGSVPIAAALVSAGMSPGAALVFLMAGPATNVATLGAVLKTFGKRVTGIYVATIVVGSLVLGRVFDFVVEVQPREGGLHDCCPTLLTTMLAGALGIVLAGFAVSDLVGWRRRTRRARMAADEELVLSVDGMTCQNCAGHVRDALLKDTNVASVQVDLESKRVTVRGQGLDRHVLGRAIRDAGYRVP